MNISVVVFLSVGKNRPLILPADEVKGGSLAQFLIMSYLAGGTHDVSLACLSVKVSFSFFGIL